MTRFRQAAAEYLAVRRALGFKLKGYDRLLEDFLDYLERCGATTVTVQAAAAWATGPAGVTTGRWADRLSAVRSFARYLQGVDPSVEVPPSDLLVCQRQHRTPYLYSPSDITRLVAAAACLRPALRGATYEAQFGLLGCTGMRVGETIALDRSDVDLLTGVVEIKDAKFRKHRCLPLHASTVAALRHYAQARDELCRKPKAASFFVSSRGTRLLYVCVNEVFRKLVEDIGMAAQPGAGHPRIHDLRHHFATTSLEDFHRSGAEPQGKLPVLSAYLGHSDPAWTYHYLHASTELLGLAAERLERWEEARR
jgi:integrase/recombinase XerD